MKEMQTEAAPPLLSYTLSTVPSPLEVSTGTPTPGQLLFAVAGNAQVLCKQIVINVPIGDDEPEIYSVTPTPTCSVDSPAWSPSSKVLSGKELGLDTAINYAVFTLDNNTSGFAVNTSFTVTISGNVNKITGDADVPLRENSAPSSNPTAYSIKSRDFTLTKSSAPAFYISNFMSSLAGTPTVPATEFTQGPPGFLLSWESNGTFFDIYEKGNTVPIYSGTAKSYPAAGGILGVVTDTTFVLVATLGEDTLSDSLTVTVSNPSLTPQSVTTAGNETVGADLQVNGTTRLADTSVAGTLGVTGNAALTNLNTGTLAVTGATSVSSLIASKLGVSGNTTLSNTAINGSLAATGNVSLGGTTVSGLDATAGVVSMLGAGVLLASGTYLANTVVSAKTDGFAVVQVLTPGDNGKSSFAYGSIYTLGTWFQVQGGTVGSFGKDWNPQMSNNPNSMCIPIPAGTNWQYYADNPDGSQMDSPIQIFWFPIGKAPGGEASYKILKEGEAPAVPPPPSTQVHMNERAEKRQANADSFIAKLEQAFGRSIQPNLKAELAALLITI